MMDREQVWPDWASPEDEQGGDHRIGIHSVPRERPHDKDEQGHGHQARAHQRHDP